MTPKTNENLKRKKSSKKNKKLKQDGVTNTPITPPSQPSPGSDDEKTKKINGHHQQDDEEDEEEDTHDQVGGTQSFAERLKVLNLQSETSNRLMEESNASETESNDKQIDEEVTGTKMLKANKISKHAVQGSTNTTNSINGIASIGSFAQTLTQALKSTDTKLLETCFLQYESKKNKFLITNTIQRLPKSLLHNLIQQLVLCLNRRKRGHGDGLTVAPVKRTKALIEWVQQILIVHMSYLLTIPSLITQLTTLHASLQKRLNLHTKLLALNGRLDLVLNQIELKKTTKDRNVQMAAAAAMNHRSMNGTQTSNKKKTQSASVLKQKPFQYVEGQSSESEAEQQQQQDDDDQMKTNNHEDDPRNTNSGSDDDDDEEEEQEEDDEENGDEIDNLSNGGSGEGSVEEVILGGSATGSDDENGSDSEADELGNQFDDLLDLEAEESLSGLGDEDDEEDEDEEDSDEDDEEEEDAGSMDGFINDETEESHYDSDSD